MYQNQIFQCTLISVLFSILCFTVFKENVVNTISITAAEVIVFIILQKEEEDKLEESNEKINNLLIRFEEL